ncbi:hypothetical protein BE17_52805 [Sorangium cellulosum]|uniref:Secreted protein n=1 Tax=Sorangium cellulosum TaxID=56 RepID=A0A150QRW9_SORCE|nr:hypothetical protein BE17_52805 [Sorangium cellulosum]
MTRRRRVAQVVAGIMAVAPLAARAQSPELAPAARASGGENEIYLKNGGMLRGTVVDVHPERPVVMVLAGTGEERAVPWPEIDRLQRGASARAAAPRGPVPPWGTPGIVRVHIETDEPQVQLMVVTGKSTVRTDRSITKANLADVVCRTPCDAIIDSRNGEEFFFGGRGIVPSSEFQLFDRSGDVSIKVDPGSTFGHGASQIMTYVGWLAALTGGLVMVNAYIQEDQHESHHGAKLVGLSIVGAGAALGGSGYILRAASQTTYELSTPGARALVAPSGLVWRF